MLTPTLLRWYRGGSGQNLLEYALIGAFIAIAVVAGASRLGDSVNDWFVNVSEVADDGTDEGSGDPGGGSNCGAQGMASSNGKCNGG